MKLNLYSHSQNSISIGFYPLATTVLLLVIHYYTGALDWPSEGDIKAQRDFNSAIGMSALTGYFWFAIRLLHQNVASALISLLVKSNQLGQFARHRSRLATEFKHHIFNTAVISILITVSYVVVEGLLSTKQELHVLILTATAVPFWFLMWLYLFQLTSNIRYLSKQILPNVSKGSDFLTALIVLVRLGVANALISVGAVIIVPIFWFKKDIPSVDLFILTLFSGALLLYLCLPIYRFKVQLGEEQQLVLADIETKMSDEIQQYRKSQDGGISRKLEILESEKEAVTNISSNAQMFKEHARLATMAMLVPLSWGIIKMLEWLVANPITQ